MAINEMVQQLWNMGFFEFVLPWLFAFAIIFGVLQKAKIFKKGDDAHKEINLVISLIAAFYLTAYTAYGFTLSTFFIGVFGNTVILLSGILLFLIFIGIFGFKIDKLLGKEEGEGPGKYLWIWVVAFLMLAYAVWEAYGGGAVLGITLDSDMAVFLFIAAIIIMAIGFVIGEGGGEAPKST
ncbi:MAG: hypothetical protein ACTSPB_04620 [Candidatus Thorarchaeota archaeon]